MKLLSFCFFEALVIAEVGGNIKFGQHQLEMYINNLGKIIASYEVHIPFSDFGVN